MPSVTLRIEKPELLDRLDQLAASTDRSRNWLLNRAFEDYLALQEWQIGKIEAGIAAADAGDFASDDEVEAIFAAHERPA
ncbi:MAG: CopG family ribbon-helix-helix protein [Beijerinckiaceae bacterium]